MSSVFLDANILFSASLTHTNMHGYFRALVHKAELITSERVYGGVERNILKKYPQNITELVRVMEQVSLVADAYNEAEFVMIHQKDRHVIAAAVKAKADYLLTGDVKDFGEFFGKKLGGVKVMSPVLLAMEFDKKFNRKTLYKS